MVHNRINCTRVVLFFVPTAVLIGLLLVFGLGGPAAVKGYMEPAAVAEGATVRASVDSEGNESNGESTWPAISADGRFVAFMSWANNLVPGDTNGTNDTFVHELDTGKTERVSVASDGTQGNGFTNASSISGDGRFVAFSSAADNLVAGDTNEVEDVFVHDRQTGSTTLISVSSEGEQGDAASRRPAISGDGRFVAFQSNAGNLVPGDSLAGGDIFVHDRQTGETTLVSVNSDGVQANLFSSHPAISADGKIVAFWSFASNLVPDDTNTTWDVFTHDRQTGTTTRVSVASDGSQANGGSVWPSLSADGRLIAFRSNADNLVTGDSNEVDDVFVHDHQTGKTVRVSVASGGAEGNGTSQEPSLASNGGFVAFRSEADNLVAGDNNETDDIFVHNLQSGETKRVSVDGSGAESDGQSIWPSISADGAVVAFRSGGTNLVDDDTNEANDIFANGGAAPKRNAAYLPVILGS